MGSDPLFGSSDGFVQQGEEVLGVLMVLHGDPQDRPSISVQQLVLRVILPSLLFREMPLAVVL
ncbi:hypothetical protein ACTXJ9_03110 [Brachybacterium tyrofermentans]|uniref:hypothetical protein n=1 Tax=Brachybacterium tyrofermentans TaxID=47848 RepID=UPI003FCF7B32